MKRDSTQYRQLAHDIDTAEEEGVNMTIEAQPGNREENVLKKKINLERERKRKREREREEKEEKRATDTEG